MTDEERRQLIAALRSETFTLEMNYKAADELERLAALAQSDAKPVTVYAITHALRHFERIIWDAGRWSNECQEKLKAALRQIDAFVDPSDAGPRPDASAGLIEAAEVVAEAERYRDFYPPNSDGFNTFEVFANKFRSRADDRSGK